MPRSAHLALGMAAGLVADRILGDPARWHPVAGFGRMAGALERAAYAPTRVRGAALTCAAVAGPAALSLAVRRLPPAAQGVAAAVLTWAVVGARSLEREANGVHAQLSAGDLDAARRRVGGLVGRDVSQASPDEIARACVESVAENSSDALIAPVFWGVLLGPSGLLGYRAVNTLDAMWGHRSPRYTEFGWAPARLDDVANWVPARVTVGLVALLTGRFRDVVTIVRRDAARHPSPNAGPVEAAWAAGLDIRLGGTNHYDGYVEDRGRLGDGPDASVADIPRATRLLRQLGQTATVLLIVRAAVGYAAARRTTAPAEGPPGSVGP